MQQSNMGNEFATDKQTKLTLTGDKGLKGKLADPEALKAKARRAEALKRGQLDMFEKGA